MNNDLICSQCPLRDCNEQSLWCGLRFATGKPNWMQKRKVADEQKRAKVLERLIEQTRKKLAWLTAEHEAAVNWRPPMLDKSVSVPGIRISQAAQ